MWRRASRGDAARAGAVRWGQQAWRSATLALGLLWALAACEGESSNHSSPPEPSDGWSTVEVGGVLTLTLPPDLRLGTSGGTDSLYREYRRPTLHLAVDYGWYSDPLDRTEGFGLARRTIEVDGRSAVLVTFRDPDATSGLAYVAALHVPDVGEGRLKLTLFARAATPRDRADAERILRSVRFSAPGPGSSREPPGQ